MPDLLDGARLLCEADKKHGIDRGKVGEYLRLALSEVDRLRGVVERLKKLVPHDEGCQRTLRAMCPKCRTTNMTSSNTICPRCDRVTVRYWDRQSCTCDRPARIAEAEEGGGG